MNRDCLDRCGELALPGSPYCRACRRRHDQARRNPARHTVRAEREARAAVDRWVVENGWWCPGWRVEAHPSRDLTADHPLAVVNGGPMVGGRLAVLCRRCNGRKGAYEKRGLPRPEVVEI